MARTTITTEGRICYRTKLMPLVQARSFAACVAANDSRFSDVQVHTSERSKTPAWYVTFRPVNPDRQDALYMQQHDARLARAHAGEFIFWPHANPGSYWCFSVGSGETYEVGLFDCSCPDYQVRCQHAGLHCKHQHARQLQADAGLLGRTDKVTQPTTETPAAFRARMLASREVDF